MSFAPLYKKRSRFALSVFALLSSTTPVLANPEGGVVAAGAADIAATGSTLNINQYSDRAVIDWRSFNVSPLELTEFHQPSTGSITVNRVNDANPSQIMGALKANGNIVIINPSGVMFGRDSKVDVGGLIATTLDVRNDDVMAGGALKFTKANGVAGRIVNEGQITAREAGLVGLVADSVENSGVIEARMGHIALASGDVASIDFQGDGLLSLEVTDENAKRLIKHSGKINAAGGNVLLTAAAGRNIVDNLIEVSGEIKTPTIAQRNGRIVIGAAGVNRTTRTGKPSRVTVSGTLSAQGQTAGETGGGIQVLADEIEVKNTARVLADGSAGGGTINIGGSFQGGREGADYNLLTVRRPELESLQAAQTVVVEKGAEINASATDNGNGGDIILWADRAIYFYGTNYARGGTNSGNGGFVETSGKHYLDYNGHTDTRAANGKVGVLLLDPTNITISDAASQNSGGPYTYSPTADDVTSIINGATIVNNLYYGDVIVQTLSSGSQLGDINVSSDFLAFGDSDNLYNLSLLADHDININANMEYYNGSYIFTAGHDINVNNSIKAYNGSIYLNAQNNVILNADVVASSFDAKIGNDLIVNADVISGSTFIDTLVANRSVSIGNNTGGINLDSTELAHFQHKNFYVGQNSNVGNITIAGTSPWEGLSAKSATGTIETIGNQTMSGGLLDLKADNLNLGGTFSGASDINISTVTNGTSIGLGDGTGGNLHLSSADLAAMAGANSYTFGNSAVSASITVAANSWTGNLNISTTNSNINVTGHQTMLSGKDMGINSGTGGTVNINGNISGGRNLTIVSDSLQLDSDVSGTGTIAISSSNAAVDVGVGTGAAGGLQLDDTELSHIKDGWSSIAINSAKDLTVNAYNWSDNLSSTAKNIAINGVQNMGSNNLTLKTSTGDIAVNAALVGSGILTLQNTSSGTANISNATGTFNLSATELDRIQDGWSQIVVGGTSLGAVNISAYTWRDPVRFTSSSGTITFSGAQNFGSNNVEISTNRLLDLNADLIGTGQLTFSTFSSSIKMTIGSTTDTLASRISAADITSFLLGKGWSSFVIGASTQTSTLAITGANNWNADLTLKTKGAITINSSSAQDVGAHNFTIETDANPNIASALSGTGVFSIKPISYTQSSKTIGLAGGVGLINLTTSELGRISNGWSQQIYGRSDQAGYIDLATNTWVDPTYFLTSDTIYFSGDQISSDTSSDLTKFVFVGGSISNGSSAAVDPGVGRYLMYSTNPTTDFYDGLTYSTKRYGKTYASYAPASVSEAGNVFFYSDVPILDVTIDNSTREYGVSDPSFTYAIDTSGLIDGDSLADALITANLTTTATATTNVGTADILGNFLSTMGYQFNVTNGTLSITKATLTATADDKTREYGLSNPSLTVSYTGFRNGDTASVIDTAATAGTTATILSNVGNYGITASGAVDNNYAFNYVVGNLSVTKATLTATADDKTREYGLSNPALTVSYAGFRNGDNASMIDTEATAGTTATTFSNVGSYGVVASGAVDNNYTFNYVGGHLTVTPKSLLVSVPSQAIRSMGTPLPYIATYSGFVNGDTDSLITRAASVRDTAGNYITPGTYQIIPFDALIGSANYSLVYAPSDLTISSVVPDSVSRTMNVPPSISTQNNIWQNVNGDAGFAYQGLNVDGSYFVEAPLNNIVIPIDHSNQRLALLSPVSPISIQVERDLALLLGLGSN